MQFGRVIGTLHPVANADQGQWHLTVTLETQSGITTVRDELVQWFQPSTEPTDPTTLADQWTQETIGNELALAGWEAIGVAEESPAEDALIPQSSTYIVRRLP